MRLAVCLIVSALLPSLAQAQSQVPVGEIVKDGSSIKFSVKASVAIDGTFDKWVLIPLPWTRMFHSTKFIETGPASGEIDGDFTIRGVTKAEKLVLTFTGKGTGTGEITGTMAFDRKAYGMNKGIPLVKIADRVEVTVTSK